MAELTRAFDWSRTPVGPIERWPDALLITVNTLLASRHPMFLWWGDELIQFYNDGYRPSIGGDKHPQALGQRGQDCWPEIWPIIAPEIDAVMTRGEASWHVNQLVPINRHGKLEEVYWTYGYSPVRNSSGDICGTLVVCTETTEIVKAKSQLQLETERLGALFQQAPAFFAVLRGPEFTFEMINPPYQELIGHRDVLGKTVRDAIPEAENQGFTALLDRVYRTGEPFVGRRTPIRLARGSSESLEIRYLDFVYQPMRDADGSICGVIALGIDATESEQAERALLQSEKLAAVGRLASSIAHEINNPLESVTNLLFLALSSSPRPEVRAYLETADRELRRVAAITSQTLRFHKQSTNPVETTGQSILESVLSLYQGRIVNSQVEVGLRVRAARPVRCFDGEIRQVISNLVGNAIDALHPHGGRLLLRTREAHDWKTGAPGLLFTVADNGSGMDRDTVSRVFEPFFTTKGYSGTGLGLWISKEIIGRHHGRLLLKSSQRSGCAGTVVTVFLPFE